MIWKRCHCFQSTPSSVSISFSPTPWDTPDPWQLLRGTAAAASPHPLPDPLCSSASPRAAGVTSCSSGLRRRKHSVLGFAGAKLLLHYFEQNEFFVDGVIKSHQALPPLYTVSICSYALLCCGKHSCVAGILGQAICHLCLASHLHTSRRKGRT